MVSSFIQKGHVQVAQRLWRGLPWEPEGDEDLLVGGVQWQAGAASQCTEHVYRHRQLGFRLFCHVLPTFLFNIINYVLFFIYWTWFLLIFFRLTPLHHLRSPFCLRKDCVFSHWSAWDGCVAGSSQQTRIREIVALNGPFGKPCTGGVHRRF